MPQWFLSRNTTKARSVGGTPTKRDGQPIMIQLIPANWKNAITQLDKNDPELVQERWPQVPVRQPPTSNRLIQGAACGPSRPPQQHYCMPKDNESPKDNVFMPANSTPEEKELVANIL